MIPAKNKGKQPEFMNPDWVIGQFLAYLRKRFGIASQAEFASHLGISRFQLARIESGRTPLPMNIAWKACRKLDVHPGFLVSTGKNFLAPFTALDPDAVRKADAMINASPDARFISFWGALYGLLFESSEAPQKSQLTNKADSLTFTGMKPVLPKLIERLKRATAERGKKSELAIWLGVHRQCVTDWLSGKQEPGGEITLKMLRWVEQQERQPK